MKTNKDRVLEYIREYSNNLKTDEYPKITTQFLAEQLELQRTNLSSILNQLVKEEQIKKIPGRPVLYQLNTIEETINDQFVDLIGYDSSLQEAIMVIKAAILYPHGNPHIMLTAETGSGITRFVKSAYGFAKASHIIKANAPIYIFDCQSYIDSIQEMKDQLFGTANTSGILHKANQGFLLIKNAHLLNNYLRNLLYASFESSKFSQDCHELPEDYRCILICQIPYETESLIIEAYKNHCNYLIDFPTWKKRTLNEKYQLIVKFFKSEAKQLHKRIQIHSRILNALALYQPQFQINGLKQDIHYACANGYTRCKKTDLSVELFMSDFSNEVRKGIIHYKQYKEELDKIVSQDTNYLFTSQEVLKNNVVTKQENIYQTIQQKKKELKKQNLSETETNVIISNELRNDFENYFKKLISNIDSMETLGKVVSPKLIQTVSLFLKEASRKVNRIFDDQILFGLCLHMNALIISVSHSQIISAEEKKRIVDLFPEYYSLAQSLVQKMQQEFQIEINQDEVIFVMLFMLSGYELAVKKKVVTLIAFHGSQSASSIAKTIQTLTHQENIYGYDLLLDKSMTVAYKELKQKMIDIDQGKGVILIYDMGSIRTMAESIHVETGIEIRFIEMPITLFGMVSVNKTNENCSLDETYQYLNDKFKDIQYKRKQQTQKALLVISPLQQEIEEAMNYLNTHFELTPYKVFPLKKTELGDIYNEIDKISQQNSIVGIISSYHLHLSQFSFLYIQDLYQQDATSLEKLFSQNDDLYNIFDSMIEQFPHLNMLELKEPLIRFVSEVPKLLNIKVDLNQKTGLLIHMICLIDKLKKNAYPAVNFIASKILVRDRKSVGIVKKELSDIENIAGISINDSEVATIISIIKKQ